MKKPRLGDIYGMEVGNQHAYFHYVGQYVGRIESGKYCGSRTQERLTKFDG